jgi:hypothetical protein
VVAPSIRKRRPIPYSDEQLEGGRGILRVWSGAVTARDVIAANADSFAREDWTKVEYVIADFTGATTVQATADEIRQISFAEVRHAMSFPHLVIAVVAPTDIIFGLARMWQVFAGATGWTLRVCRSRDEAEGWVRVLRSGHPQTPP